MPGLGGRAGGEVPDGTPPYAAHTGKRNNVGRGPSNKSRVKGTLYTDYGESGVPG